MAESIKFTDTDRNKTLAIPEAQQFLTDGVLNPASEDWTKLSKETQINILDECAKLSDATQKGCNDLKAELENLAPAVSAKATEKSAISGYTTGPLKESVNIDTDFQKISDNMTPAQMGMIVKANINLMQTKVREQWFKHFDDALLGSGAGFVYSEFEHLGRIIQPSTEVTTVANAGNIVAFGQTHAAAQIDALVSVNNPDAKNILKAMNEAVIDENGALMMWVGLYLAAKTVGPVLTATLKGILKLLSIKGKGGVQLVALGAELYEAVDRKMKGADPANKSLWDSIKDRIKGETLVGKKASELAENEKKMKTEQVEGVREIVRDALHEKYGKGLTRAKFETEMNASTRSTKDMVSAKNAEKDIMGKMEKHLPIDLSPDANDRYELDEKFRNMALDMEVSTWKKIRTGLFRFFFEKGGITNLVFQNGIVDLSNRVGIGTKTKNTLAEKLDTIKIDIGEGKEISVPRVDETRFKELIQHIDADVALATQTAEMAALKKVHDLDAEIKILKADNIPDTEQGVKDLEEKLETAKTKYAEFEKLHNNAITARTTREIADTTVKTQQQKVEDAKGELEIAKANTVLYNEYGTSNSAHEEAMGKQKGVEIESNIARQALLQNIKAVEAELKSNSINITEFDKKITEVNFTTLARNHINELTDKAVAYNKIKANVDTKIDIVSTFGRANNALDTVSQVDGKLAGANADTTRAKTVLDAKIVELTDAGLWDTNNKVLSTDLKTLKAEEKTAKATVETEEKALAETVAKKTGAEKVVDTIKSQIKQHSANEIINNPTATDPSSGNKTRTIKSVDEIDDRLKKAQEMKKKLAEQAKAKESVTKTESARIVAAQKVGESGETKPKIDGTHSTESQEIFNKLDAKKTETMTSYTDYVTRAAAKGRTFEVKDGKATITDTAGKKIEFDMKNAADRAKLFKEIK